MELSIVLVILGLLVGGVLSGQALIQAAQMRQQIKQFEKISTGLNAFRDKYLALPGDMCANADAFGLGCGNAAGARDDGELHDFNGSGGAGNHHGWAYEPVYFFDHLVLAGLLEPRWVYSSAVSGACQQWTGGNPIPNVPWFYATVLNPNAGMAAFTIKGKNWLFLGIQDCNAYNFTYDDQDDGTAGGVSGQGTLTPQQAEAIDGKMDDDSPGTGRVIATVTDTSTGDYIMDGLIDTYPGKCVLDATAKRYNVQEGAIPWCRLLVQL